VAAAALTHGLPAGEYDRRSDPATRRSVVVAGSYHPAEPAPVGAFDAVVAVPRGMASAAPVIFFIFLIGGAVTVVDRTGLLRGAVDALARRLAGRESLVIPGVSLLFAAGGFVEGMQEEIIPLVPALLVLGRRFGFDGVTVVGMSLGAALVGGAFSPMNPFIVGIAQKLAELPALSGAGVRLAVLVVALALWIRGVARHAVRTRQPPASDPIPVAPPKGVRSGLLVAIILVTLGSFVYGVARLDWGFEEMGAAFFLMGVTAGIVGGLGVEGTVTALIDGFREIAFAGLIVGFARAIFVVLEQGHVIDTIVHGLFTPISGLPVPLAALGMLPLQAAVHVAVPSTTGQAVLTLPVLVPLSDLLGLSRQVTVMAYQYGAGLCEFVTPTNGALVAILTAAGVRLEDWLRFATPLVLGLLALAAVAIGTGLVWGI